MSSSGFALQINALQKNYGKRAALRNLNLSVPRGAVLGLIGPNGAGKTTTFAIVAGLLSSNGGTIDVLGNGPYDPVKHKGALSLLPQDAFIPGHSRVREALVHFGRLQGLEPRAARYHADKTLEWVDLSDRANSAVSTLSHGMIRRLSVAQAFLGEPDLVLLDEPTSGLDPRQVVRVRDLIISRRGQQTIIISSHILSEIEAACDHVAFMENGVTTRQETMDAITNRSKSVTVILESQLTRVPAELYEHLPSVSFVLPDGGKQLSITFDDGLSTEPLNKIVIPVLLNLGINIEEIRRGGDLEKIYLEDSKESLAAQK